MGRWPHRLGNSPNADELPGVSGGVLSEDQGGKFGAGFLASCFSSVGDSFLPDRHYGNVVKAAVIGGTASEIGGGEFANGAVTGSFTYLFNQALSPDKETALLVEAQEEFSQIKQKAKEFLEKDKEYNNPFIGEAYMCGEQREALQNYLDKFVKLKHFRFGSAGGCENDNFPQGTAANQCHNVLIVIPNTRWGQKVSDAIIIDTFHGPQNAYKREVKIYSPEEFTRRYPTNNNIWESLPDYKMPE